MSVATALRAIRPDTLLDTVRTRHIVDALAAARPTGQVVAVCGLHDGAGASTVSHHLAQLVGRFHRGKVVVVDADLDRTALAQRTHPDACIELDELEAFLRTPSSVEPPWYVAAPVVDDAGAHPASHVAGLLSWSRSRLDTVLVDVPSRWRRSVLDSLLQSLDVLVVAARAGQPVESEIGVARHWLHGQGRSDLAERLVVVESHVGVSDPPRPSRSRAGRWFHLGSVDPESGWSDLSRRDRDECLRLGAALRR
jgi:hypothetical protein